MAKISPVSAKYIVQGSIEIDGVVDKPDVIGAIFGQTEGLLGADLELRELQRSGRIGRIEVDTDTKSGKTKGMIIIPSSLDKVETCIVGASLETIQRIGPCNARIKVLKIEDVRVSKRTFVIERAKDLLRTLIDVMMPDSQELSDEVAYSVRVMELQEYGRDRLPAGPGIEDSDEIIVVEGRADVLNLLKHGFKNAIAVGGTNIPPTIVELMKAKTVTIFTDGDRGGDLIIKALMQVAEIDFVAKAPDGKEVEELAKKEIHQALRARVNPEQFSILVEKKHDRMSERAESRVDHAEKLPSMNNAFAAQDRERMRTEQRPERTERPERSDRPPMNGDRGPPRGPRPPMPRAPPQEGDSEPAPIPRGPARKEPLNAEDKKKFGGMLEELIGSRGAFLLDEHKAILGRVPTTELNATLRNMKGGVMAIILDGFIDRDLIFSADKLGVQYVIGKEIKFKPGPGMRVEALTQTELV